MKKPIRLTLIALFLVLALVAAACGSDTEQGAPRAPGGSEEPAVLPPNSNPDATPDPIGACLVGEPECNDTAGPGDEPQDLPPPSDALDEPAATGMLVDGGLSIADALALTPPGLSRLRDS